MALIVENGTGLTSADSYVSAGDCVIYANAHGLTFTDNAAGEAALRRATGWLDATYMARWPGVRAHGRDQALQWPRTGAEDIDGNPIGDDEIPAELIDALCEAACRELATTGALSPDVVPAQIVQSASVDGAVSVTYAGKPTAADMMPIITTVDNILAPLIGRKPSAVIFGMSLRT